jgi:hypothetical protein
MVSAEVGWDLNEPQIATLEKFLSHAKRAHEIDCKIRKDGVETWYELDSIKHMVPARTAITTGTAGKPGAET